MNKKYIVRLSADERAQLDAFLAAGKAPARSQTHARILLKADCGPDGPAWPDHLIVDALEVSRPTIQRVRQTLVLQGFDAALHRKPQPPRPHKVDGRHEAHLAALACSTPPAGFKRWTLRLLTKHFVALEEVELESIGRETVRQVLKKTSSNHG